MTPLIPLNLKKTSLSTILPIPPKDPRNKMIEPVESSKPDTWSGFLGSLATFFAALSIWFYRKAGQSPRPEVKVDTEAIRGDLEKIINRLQEISDDLAGTRTRVIRVESHISGLSDRLARVEGHQQSEA